MRKLYFFLAALLVSLVSVAQTIVINPATNGGFESGTDFGTNGWTVVNGTATNKWFVGTIPPGFTNRSAYISSDGAGSVWSFDNTASTTVHFYRDVTIPAGETDVTLSFNWAALGETSAWDALMVSIAPTTYTPVASSTSPGTSPLAAPAVTIVQLFNSASVQSYTTKIPTSLLNNCTAAVTIRLIFTWKNDGILGDNPPAAVDNISLVSQAMARIPASGGVFTINNAIANTGTNFTTFTEAINNLNARGFCGLTGSVTFNVADGQTFTENPPAIIAIGSSSSPVTFQKAGTGANPVIRPSGTTGIADFGMALYGSDYITINGIDIHATTSNVEFGFLVRNASATDGATFNSIRNSKIILDRTNTGTAALIQTSTTTGGGFVPSAASGANKNNKYYNIVVENSYTGIHLLGGSTTNIDELNEIGTIAGGITRVGTNYSSYPSGDIGTVGIQATNQLNVKIFNTLVQNMAASGVAMRGINLVGLQGALNEINNNKIRGVAGLSTTSTTVIGGLDVNLATTGTHAVKVYNNMVSDITSAYAGALSATHAVRGMMLGNAAATSTYNIDFNSVAVSGPVNASSSAIYLNGSTAITNLRNNIFANYTPAQSGVAKHYSIRTSSATALGASASIVNYNDYFIQDPTNGYVGLTNTADQATIADWTLALTGNPGIDANSISADPGFYSMSDIHASAPAVNNAGNMTGITWVTIDIDGQARNATTPDMGADEFTPVPTDIGVTRLISPPSTLNCETTAVPVTIQVKNFGSSAVNFVTNPLTVNASVSGTNATTFTPVVVNTGTLAPGATMDIVVSPNYNMSAAGTYTFNASITFTGDGNAMNDVMDATSRTIAAPVSLPQNVSFTGYNGSNLTAVFPNWREAQGWSTPTGTTSNWTSQTGLGGTGNISARVNLYTTSFKEWLVGPKFVAAANTRLRFQAAISDWNNLNVDPQGMQGSDDSVTVRISTDCGATWTDVFVLDANNTTTLTNVFEEFEVDLSAYAGQRIMVAFFGTDGVIDNSQDYDVHIDNISIVNVLPNDVSAISLVAPATTSCPGANTPVTIRIKNTGSNIINLATTPVTVTTNVTGAATQTLTGVANTGTLLSGATMDVTMTGTLNNTAAGTYTFNAFTSMTGDGDAANDSMPAAARTTIAAATIPQNVTFTGFTGSNLSTTFPGWYEATGLTTPAGTTSNWTSQNNLGSTGNVTARINLDFNTGRDWIVGPRIVPTATTRLRFEAAITDWGNLNPDADGMQGTDDSVIVRLSLDCGQTWMDAMVFEANTTATLSNTLTEFEVDLGLYAGQNVIVAFYATEGTVSNTPDYDFHLDNIRIINVFPTDISAIALASPGITGCPSATTPVTITVKNVGTGILNFATTPLTVTTNVTGAATQTLTGTVNTGTLIPGGTLDVLMSTSLNMTAPGTYSFTAYTTLTGDAQASNDTMAVVTRTTVAPASLPQIVSFTGFTGSNLSAVFPGWSEATGITNPTGTTSSWTSQTNLGTTGNVTARLNLVGATKKEWIIGPKFVATALTRLRFDAAITDAASLNADPDGMQGTDDSVTVRISTDCGLTWNDVYVFDANNTSTLTNVLTEYEIDLGMYAGMNVIVAFFGTEGSVDNTPSYDFHLDNIRIAPVYPTDIGAIGLATPVAGGCPSATTPVTITVKNLGSAILNFATTPLTVTTNVTGAVTQTLTGTVTTGTLIPGGTLDVLMSSTLNMNTAGTYTFNAYSTLTGDQQVSNDTMPAASRISVAPVALPQTVNFTGFTGANLTTVFPNWREGTGLLTPTGTTSNWTSQTGLGGTGNITARVNLWAVSKRDWIVGPKVTATSNTILTFKAAITNFGSLAPHAAGMQGTDDSVSVRVSTDCGLTWTDVYTLTAANTTTLTNVLDLQTVDLTAYAGQNIIVAFYASEGFVNDAPDYDFHIDDINIADVPACTGAVGGTAVAPATSTFCGSGSATITASGYSAGRLSGYQWESSTSSTFASGGSDVPGMDDPATMNTGVITDTTYYRLRVTCPNGTTIAYSNIIAITVNPRPTIVITPSAPAYCPGGSVSMTASGADTYVWSPATGLSATTGATVTANPTVTTVYTVTGTTTATGCTNTQTVRVTVNPSVTVTASAAQPAVCSGSSTQLTASAMENRADVKISEVTVFRTGQGATSPYPSFISTTAQDFVELTNIGVTPANISGFTISSYANNTGTTTHNYTFPAGTTIPVGGVIVVHLGTGTNSVANGYYNTGGSNDIFSSSSAVGIVLKNAGTIIDAVGLGGSLTGSYTFAAATGVTAADWSGFAPNASGLAGSVRTAPTDSNTGADWTQSGAANVQTMGTFNPGYVAPSGGFTYSWSPATGLSNSTIANPVATVTSNIVYTVTATETTTGCSSSTTVSLTVADLPAITSQPGNQTICAGGNASFNVTATGTGITYQWRRNGVNLPGATASTFSITGATTSEAGTYDVVVSGQCPPAVTSTGAILTVDSVPVIHTQPASQSVCLGSSTTFSVGASGSNLTYQWYKGSNPIATATGSSYTIAAATAADADNYYVIVSGSCAPAATSNTVTLSVNGAPIISGQPAPLTVCLGQPASFTVTATGSGLTYQWRKNGTNIAGATSASYSLAATAAGDGGNYDVVITSSCATTTTSNAVTLTVNMPPAITVQPTAQTTCIANSATFSVTATGAGLTYQWRKNGLNIAGANGTSLTINNVTAADLGNFDVVVTGTCGTPVTSNSVALNLSSTNTWLGRLSSDWNNPANWCSGVPTSTTDVLFPAGTNFPAILSGSGSVRNVTIGQGATLSLPAGGILNLYGDLVTTGTLSSANGQIIFRGATNQAIPAVTAAYIVMNGAGGITLSGNMTVGTGLTLTNGNITLGSSNLIMTGGSMGSVASHIITNGTGVVTINNVGTAAVVFPIGPDAASYNPAAVANGGGRSFNASVVTGITTAIPNPTRAINRTWTIIPSAASATPAYVGFQYADAHGNASYSPTIKMEIGVHNGTSWTQITVPGGMNPVGTANDRGVGSSTTTFGQFVTSNVGGIFSPTALPNMDSDVTRAVLMPNVVKDKSVLQVVVRRAVKVDFTISDASGRIVRTFTKQLVAGVNTINLRLGDLAGGSYYISGVTEKGRMEVLRMIRQ